jgi:hypothetical protein
MPTERSTLRVLMGDEMARSAPATWRQAQAGEWSSSTHSPMGPFIHPIA